MTDYSKYVPIPKTDPPEIPDHDSEPSHLRDIQRLLHDNNEAEILKAQQKIRDRLFQIINNDSSPNSFLHSNFQPTIKKEIRNPEINIALGLPPDTRWPIKFFPTSSTNQGLAIWCDDHSLIDIALYIDDLDPGIDWGTWVTSQVEIYQRVADAARLVVLALKQRKETPLSALQKDAAFLDGTRKQIYTAFGVDAANLTYDVTSIIRVVKNSP